MFCKQCGSEIADAAVMCVKCGVPTGVANPVATTTGKDLSKSESICGWLGAVFMPIIGIIIGIIALTRGKVGTGIGMIALSIFMAFFWMGFMSAL